MYTKKGIATLDERVEASFALCFLFERKCFAVRSLSLEVRWKDSIVG